MWVWSLGLGACLAKKQVSVVYGGSRFGLMGKMADSLLQNGGKITGIIPEFFTSTCNRQGIHDNTRSF